MPQSTTLVSSRAQRQERRRPEDDKPISGMSTQQFEDKVAAIRRMRADYEQAASRDCDLKKNYAVATTGRSAAGEHRQNGAINDASTDLGNNNCRMFLEPAVGLGPSDLNRTYSQTWSRYARRAVDGVANNAPVAADLLNPSNSDNNQHSMDRITLRVERVVSPSAAYRTAYRCHRYAC